MIGRKIDKIEKKPKLELPWNFAGWKEHPLDESNLASQKEWNQTFLSVLDTTAKEMSDITLYVSKELMLKLIGGLNTYSFMTDKIGAKYKVVTDDYISKRKVIITSEDSEEGMVIIVENLN